MICAYCLKYGTRACPRHDPSIDDPTLTNAPTAETCKKFSPRPLKPRFFVELPDGRLAETVISGEFPCYAVYNPKNGEVEMAYYADKYRPKTEWDVGKGIIEKSITLPTGVEDYGDIKRLINEVDAFIRKYVDFNDPSYYTIATYYVLFSWVYDRFWDLCYLRLRGNKGSGKSRALSIIGRICYRPTDIAGAVTSAALYRIVDMSKGTVLIDEADKGSSEYWNDIVKVLNLGTIRGGTVIRCRTDDPSKFEAFDVFSPKIIAMRGVFDDDALESRLVNILMFESKKMPAHIDWYRVQKEQESLRNKLLMFRFEKWHKIDLKQCQEYEKLIPQTVEPRVRQVLVPLLSIIEDRNELDEMIEFTIKYAEELKEQRSESIEGQVAQAIADLMAIQKEVFTDDLLLHINQSLSTYEQLTPQRLGKILKKMTVHTIRVRHGRNRGRRKISMHNLDLVFANYGVIIPNGTSGTNTGGRGKGGNSIFNVKGGKLHV